VKHIPKALLAIIPKNVIYLIASAGRKIKITLLKGNIHASLHKEILKLLINDRYLAVILSEKAGARLLGINSVMNKNIVYPTYTLCQSKSRANEAYVLENIKLGVEGNLHILNEGGSEQLVPNVACGAAEDEVGILVLR
jgi:hypothetical protein